MFIGSQSGTSSNRSSLSYKKVPGRKTDTADCQWIAQLLRHGLLKASFVPPLQVRQLRDLCRTRTSLTQEKTAVVNRLQKTLEDANVKLAAVVTDILGVSGRAMLKQIVAGKSDVDVLAELARGPMRKKRTELQQALTGRITPHHRFLLKQHIEHIEYLEKAIANMVVEIERQALPFEATITRWKSIPGIEQLAARSLVAEIGANMDQFPTARHLVSWAGLCPGNHESAGKRLSGKTRKANPWLKGLMTQVAWAASHTRYLLVTTVSTASYQARETAGPVGCREHRANHRLAPRKAPDVLSRSRSRLFRSAQGRAGATLPHQAAGEDGVQSYD